MKLGAFEKRVEILEVNVEFLERNAGILDERAASCDPEAQLQMQHIVRSFGDLQAKAARSGIVDW